MRENCLWYVYVRYSGRAGRLRHESGYNVRALNRIAYACLSGRSGETKNYWATVLEVS
jgi:hypothetical protein